MNERLPFDVLTQVFSCYREEEDVFHSTETLLLVCRFWAEVALSNRALWSGFKIIFGHQSVMNLWKKLLPLRLVRSGDTVPLDIHIRCETYGESIDREVLQNSSFYPKKCFNRKGSTMSRCFCHTAHAAMIAWIIEVLVGANAKLCARWRTFNFQGGTMRYLVDLETALKSPTPSLISLSLASINLTVDSGSNSTLLPSAPLLREVNLSGIRIPRLPNLTDVRNLNISNLHITEEIHISVEKVGRMQELAISQGGQKIILPQVLHELSRLALTAPTPSSTFEGVHMPRLTHLSVRLGDWHLCRQVAECTSFPLEQLVTLEIQRLRRSYTVPKYSNLNFSVFGLLRRGVCLESIISSPPFFNLMLKWMWEDKRSLEGGPKPWICERGVILMSPSGGCLGRLTGDESSAELESLARDWGFASPDVSWDTLFSILFHEPES